MSEDTPIRLPSCKARAGKGVIWLRKGGQRSKVGGNSGPSNKRAARFYPQRALRQKLGKHGIARLKR